MSRAPQAILSRREPEGRRRFATPSSQWRVFREYAKIAGVFAVCLWMPAAIVYGFVFIVLSLDAFKVGLIGLIAFFGIVVLGWTFYNYLGRPIVEILRLQNYMHFRGYTEISFRDTWHLWSMAHRSAWKTGNESLNTLALASHLPAREDLATTPLWIEGDALRSLIRAFKILAEANSQH
jgi:hypothetical protein